MLQRNMYGYRIFTSDIPGPLHEEVLSESPSIVMFHDFLTSEEIKFMKNTIMSQMKVLSKCRCRALALLGRNYSLVSTTLHKLMASN